LLHFELKFRFLGFQYIQLFPQFDIDDFLSFSSIL
jgi:hypothetical protein